MLTSRARIPLSLWFKLQDIASHPVVWSPCALRKQWALKFNILRSGEQKL